MYTYVVSLFERNLCLYTTNYNAYDDHNILLIDHYISLLKSLIGLEVNWISGEFFFREN
jgi:hypothetical protein